MEQGGRLGKTRDPRPSLILTCCLWRHQEISTVSCRTGSGPEQALPPRRGTKGVYRLVYLQIY